MYGFRLLLRLGLALSVFIFAGTNSYAGTEVEVSGDLSAHNRQVRQGGVYRAPLLNNPPTLDPAYVQDMYGVAVVQQLFDGLVQFSPDLYVIPALAENWEVEEAGKTYRFSLRRNARFHNGRPVTAQDVVFSLSRLLRVDPPPAILLHLLKITGARDYLERRTDTVAGLQVIDDNTLLIHLDQAYVPFIIALGMYQAKIVPQEVVGIDERRFGTQPVGSGPFRFASWEENKRIRLQGFSDYYAGRPFLDEIEYAIYPGVGIEGVWADFQSGKLDEMRVSGNLRDKLKDRKDLQWVHRPSLSLQFYGFNCSHLLLKDQGLRTALTLAIDREALVAEVYNNQREAARGILPPGLPGYHPRDLKIGADTAKAKELLERALGGKRLSRPIEIEIVSNSQSPVAKAELEFVRKSWAKLGIELETKFIPDWAQFERYIQSDAMQIYRYAWFADMPDPDDILRPLFSAESQSNFLHYRSREVDQMLGRASVVTDPVERAGMYQQIEQTILESSPIIPLIHLSIDSVYQPYVRGIAVSALGAHTMSFHRVWLEHPAQ